MTYYIYHVNQMKKSVKSDSRVPKSPSALILDIDDFKVRNLEGFTFVYRKSLSI